ncbi:glycosyltransferase family 2 protein [Anaerostipes faecalis]|uniref:glycosyltransferase family 2 protein n=1 Tax=Anaerostipes faecalis TaxID=2738446 RepID=UPI003F09C064
MNKTISVIIPFYNTRPFIQRCLNSVIHNTYKDLQILCVDNGSTDGSYEYLKEFAKKDSRIIVIQELQKGVSCARNKGISMATGDYVSFIDSDDWIHPYFFQELIDCAEKHQSDVVICRHYETNHFEDWDCSEQSGIEKEYSLQDVLNDFHVKTKVWARLYNRNILSNHHFDETIDFSEDMLFNLDVLCLSKNIKIMVIEDRLYYYFLRNTSATCTALHCEIILVGEKLIEHSTFASDDLCKYFMLIQGIKSVLAGRYLSMFLTNFPAIKKHCNQILKNAFINLKTIQHFNIKQKIQYGLLIHFPTIYRFLRILNDNTMLQWEKQEKS